MGEFASEQEVYAGLGDVLKNAVTGADTVARLQQTDAVVQYRLTDPTATITLDARASSDTKIDLGETQLEPEIVFSLPADTAQRLFAGDLALTEALAAGEIASKGPVGKMLKLLPAIGSASVESAPAAQAPEAEQPESPEDESADPEAGASESEPQADPEPEAEPQAEPAAEPSAE